MAERERDDAGRIDLGEGAIGDMRHREKMAPVPLAAFASMNTSATDDRIIEKRRVTRLVILAAGAVAGEEIELLRTPNDGIQPQAAIDERGNLHVIYFSGDRKSGNLYYVTRAPGAPEWSEPRRVNSERGSAHRNGAISHAQLALGARGRVHVSWFNMQPPRYFYSRARDDG